MKITSDKFEISASQSFSWEDIKTLRLLNEKLAVVLKDGRVIELSHLRPGTIDMAFRFYEKYLHEHPEKRNR